MIGWLKRLFSGGGDDALAALQQRFKERYARYQQLLAANQLAVETIAEIEGALEGERPLLMAEVRALCTRAAGQVFQMIGHLDALSDQRYGALFDRFNEIQGRLNPVLLPVAASSAFPLVVPLAEAGAELVEQVGGKLATLGELAAVDGARIPDGFVVTANAYRRFIEERGLQREIDRHLVAAAGDRHELLGEACQQIRRLIRDAELPAEVADAVRGGYADLCARAGRVVQLAVRSSALGEDGVARSFAGQYRSVLGVSEDGLLAAYKEVVASSFSLPAIRYRAHYGIRDDDVAMCVGCMTLVDAVAGGVIYTADPVGGSVGAVLVYAAPGAPVAVVDGSGRADRYEVAREGGAVLRQEVVGGRPAALTPARAVELARIALAIEERYGAAQDIEWALDADGDVVLLQSRPLTLSADARPAARAPAPGAPQKVLVSGGVTASRGVAFGPVHAIEGPADERAVAPGSVLVTELANPELAALLDGAVAVVAEQGSVACHLATVAREYGVPALFGVSRALEELNAGDAVTVDADQRVVYAGKVGDVLARPPAVSRILGSPVHQALTAAAEHIVPLGLHDPHDPAFAPEGCRTLHDITRFCHEKSVLELARYGAAHELPKRASRRLFTDVATQFWVVDLDDGIDPEATDPYLVRLTEVRSLPMRALWRGMHLVPWEGPPPVDAKGFLGLVAGSTMDPNLVPSAASDYATGSHFFITRAYCGFQYRIGYHFSSVEALVGDDVPENFVRFQFSGGGASPDRRHRRARMIAEILERKNFRVRRQGDVVTARLDGYDRSVSEWGLVVLGYLLVQTRQLDMVMRDEAALERYKQKLLDGLDQSAIN